MAKPRRVRRAMRVHDVVHAGQRAGGLCAEGALSGLRHSRTVGNEQLLRGPGRTSRDRVHVLQTRDLLTIIHLLPRKAGRCGAAPLLAPALFAAGETAKALLA